MKHLSRKLVYGVLAIVVLGTLGGGTLWLKNNRSARVQADAAFKEEAQQAAIVIKQYQALRQSLADFSSKGGDGAAINDSLPAVRSLIDSKKYGQAATKISELTTQLEALVAAKAEQDRLAQEAETARLKAEEEARKLVAATPSPKPSPKPTPARPPSPAPTPAQVAPPSDGDMSYHQESIATNRGTYTVRYTQVNLASGKYKVVTDTASDNDCTNNCPVLPLADYVKRNGGIAGINGTYFCPQDYSSCQNEVNSFFWKIYNTRLRKMINASNGLGELDPFLVFTSSGQAHWLDQWQSYKSVSDMVAGINSKPALVVNGNMSVNEASLDDKQRTAKISRGALGLKGQVLYLAVVSGATVTDSGAVMQQMGMDYALNIDAGGSSAMIYNGMYMIGPGRNIPNALIIVPR